jgi:3-hydroxy-9,10-secoandrosta-1,3,5(10)-triene-9,17-dione monooxygenase reductase component
MSSPLAAAEVSPLNLRRAAGTFPTGVALVTAPGPLALVIDSFISVSLEPPLIAFSPSRTSLTWRRMRSSGRLAVSVLGAHHAEGIHERARPGADRLRGLEIESLAGGVPVVRDALAVLLCTLETEHDAGDHTVAIGKVHEIRHGGGERPLVFYRGDFGTVSMPARAPDGVRSRIAAP